MLPFPFQSTQFSSCMGFASSSALVATQEAAFLSYNGCRLNGAVLCGNVSLNPVAEREYVYVYWYL